MKEISGFFGPNAEGKTTLLRATLGEIAPQRGEVRFGFREGIREHIGFVPQRCDLNPTLPTTVREFVSLGLPGSPSRRKKGPGGCHRRYERVGLEGMHKEDYRTL